MMAFMEGDVDKQRTVQLPHGLPAKPLEAAQTPVGESLEKAREQGKDLPSNIDFCTRLLHDPFDLRPFGPNDDLNSNMSRAPAGSVFVRSAALLGKES